MIFNSILFKQKQEIESKDKEINKITKDLVRLQREVIRDKVKNSCQIEIVGKG